MNTDPAQILRVVGGVIGFPEGTSVIPLHEPMLHNTNALMYLDECIKSGWVSTAGEWVGKFERIVRDYTGAKEAVAVNCGTNALRLGLYLTGVGRDTEVVMSPISFVATANAVAHLGAIPHFVDIDRQSLGIDSEKLSAYLEEIAEIRNDGCYNKNTGRKISAIVPVHVFGEPGNIKGIQSTSEKWRIPIVEDAAEALGSWRDGIHCGLNGSIGALSFNGNKLITTGGGGMLITMDEELGKKARHIASTAKVQHQWRFVHDEIGWNDRMPNVNAAIGYAQMEHLQERLDAKKALKEAYRRAFSSIKSVSMIEANQPCTSNNWLISIQLMDESTTRVRSSVNYLLEEAHSAGILMRPVWTPLHKLKMYRECPRDSLTVSEYIGDRVVSLPSSPQLAQRL